MPSQVLSSPRKAASIPWYRQRWPWLLMLGPAIVVVAGVYTGWLAFTRQDALVVDDYYKEGKTINRDLRRDREASRQGVAIELNYVAASGKLNGVVRTNATAEVPTQGRGRGEEKLPVSVSPQALPPALTLQLLHPTLPEKDLRLVLYPMADGRFSVAVPALDQARWRILIEDGKRNWRLHGNLTLPQQTQITLRAQDWSAADN